MNILQMVDVPWDSGLAHYALLLSHGLRRNGHQVYVSARPGKKPWQMARHLGLETVPLVSLGSICRLRRFLLERKIDLINPHTGSSHSLAMIGALGHPVALVRTRGDSRPLRLRPASGLLHERTQRIIAAAEFIRRDYLRTFRLPEDKVVTIHQGIDLAGFDPSPPPPEPVVGIVARLDPVKGHRYLLEAMALLRDRGRETRLRVAGREEHIKERELQALAARFGLAGRVSLEGFQKSVPEFMSGCAAGVISSVGSEAVSRAALEWMAAGRPLVATSVGCLAEMVVPGETGALVEPRNAAALAGGLDSLLSQGSRLEAWGRAARARAEDRFALPRVVEATEKIYAEAVEEVKCRG